MSEFKFNFSFRSWLLFVFSLQALLLAYFILQSLIYQNSISYYEIIKLAMIFLLLSGYGIITGRIIIENSYIKIQSTGIERGFDFINIHNQIFIGWQQIHLVKYSNNLVLNGFYILPEKTNICMGRFKYAAYIWIPLFSIDTVKFKAAVISHTTQDNLLHQAVTKYI